MKSRDSAGNMSVIRPRRFLPPARMLLPAQHHGNADNCGVHRRGAAGD
jgi:hypothetical protein